MKTETRSGALLVTMETKDGASLDDCPPEERLTCCVTGPGVRLTGGTRQTDAQTLTPRTYNSHWSVRCRR
ncbi:Hypothetical predicted protein [Xyrichtys novacula]|uniref:Uncharacterized protein n=1 Tax=Xyrichtys novacula TaxID=13765 RepID=A0AAV1FZ28_XYRNO|nr:Hypothetical predicted protein [Xyrichtys novacula]